MTQTNAVIRSDFRRLTSNFHLYRRGQVESDGFNITAFEEGLAMFSDDEAWQSLLNELIPSCARACPASLTPQQQAIDIYTCIKWSLFADCDQQQDNNGTLDDTGKLRRARFLSGDCPLSPNRLLDAFGRVTNRTWADCSAGLYSGDNNTLLYEAAVNRTACLLQNFVNQSNMVDFQALVNAIEDADTNDFSASTDLLIRLVEECAVEEQGDEENYRDMTPEDFVNCWAGLGVLSCAKHEAAQLASSFPEACVFSSA